MRDELPQRVRLIAEVRREEAEATEHLGARAQRETREVFEALLLGAARRAQHLIGRAAIGPRHKERARRLHARPLPQRPVRAREGLTTQRELGVLEQEGDDRALGLVEFFEAQHEPFAVGHHVAGARRLQHMRWEAGRGHRAIELVTRLAWCGTRGGHRAVKEQPQRGWERHREHGARQPRVKRPAR